MSTIYRSTLDNLWIKIQSNETLGILDGSYLEDYFGNEGQVTLHHIPTQTDHALVMTEVVNETPEIPHDVFRGMISLAALPNGDYEVRGRCRDLASNYTILSSVASPYGGERVVSLPFTILPGSGANFNFTFAGGLLQPGFTGSRLIARDLQGRTLSRPHL